MKGILFKRPKAKNGDGRSVKIKHLMLPEELVEDLKLYKDCYSIILAKEKDENEYPIPVRISYEQMLRHWTDNLENIDPDVQQMFMRSKKEREKNFAKMAAGMGMTAEQFKANQADFDPTESVNEPWNLRYIFEKDGDEVEAIPGDKAPFYAKIGGRNVGMRKMLANDWILMNDAGIELDIDQAWQINKLIKEHIDG